MSGYCWPQVQNTLDLQVCDKDQRWRRSTKIERLHLWSELMTVVQSSVKTLSGPHRRIFSYNVSRTRKLASRSTNVS